VKDNNNRCLLNAICASLYGEELRESLGPKKYEEIKGDGVVYHKFHSRVKTGKATFPAGLDDLREIEKHNPCYKFHVYQPFGSEYYKIYQTKSTPKHRELEETDRKKLQNVYLVLAFYICPSSKEIKGHWFCINSLPKFAARKYFSVASNPNDPKIVTSEEKCIACPHCSRKFAVGKNSSVTTKYTQHRQTCKSDTISELKMPSERDKFLYFKDYAKTHPARFSIYLDFETTNSPLPILCTTCHEMYKSAVGKDAMAAVVKNCSESRHTPSKYNDCSKCYQTYLLVKRNFRLACIDLEHIAEDSEKMCDECNILVTDEMKQYAHSPDCDINCTECNGRERCKHSSTSMLTRLDPILYVAVVYDQKFGRIHKTQRYTGEDCVEHLIKFLEGIECELKKLIKVDVPIDRSTIDHEKHDSAKVCYSCLLPFDRHGKQEDHCHVTGQYRGPACLDCNLKMIEPERVKVWVHNLVNFDSHLIAAGFKSEKYELTVVPLNSEKCKLLKFSMYDFVDSFSFQSQSLSALTDKLVKQKQKESKLLDIVANCEELCFTNGSFDMVKYGLCLEKAGFPYLLATSIKDLKQIKKFPPIEDFKSSLTGCDIDENTYLNGKKMFELQNFDSMMEYYSW
jgi:hypothetical protein